MRGRGRLPWRQRFGNRNRRRVAAVASPDAADSLLDGIAGALAELRLAGHEPTERAVARDIVALGLGASGTQENTDG
jgi:hypothetical protein